MESCAGDEQQTLLARALEGAANAIFVADRDGRIVWVNAAFCRQSGYAREEVIGRTPRLLMSGRQGPEFYRGLWQSILSGRPWQGELGERRRLAVLFLDLDRFKNVNDALGHAVGDRLLVAVADRLRAAVRRTDTVARMSGDEFTILLPDLNEIEVARALARKLVASIALPFALGKHKIETGVSIGIAVCPDDGDIAEALLASADAAMYRAKTHGHSRFCFAGTN